MKSLILFLIFALIISFLSCKKDMLVTGIPTVIKGHVEDPVRNIPISGYKIVLVKQTGITSGGLMGMQGTRFEKVAETYTDSNGDYLLMFDYQLAPGQGYYFAEQYYGVPYFHETTSASGPIIAGTSNVVNITAWKPVELN